MKYYLTIVPKDVHLWDLDGPVIHITRSDTFETTTKKEILRMVWSNTFNISSTGVGSQAKFYRNEILYWERSNRWTKEVTFKEMEKFIEENFVDLL